MTELELFAHCALPGCANITDTQGHPCTDCRTQFGELLRPSTDTAPMTAEAQAHRDDAARLAYRAQRVIAVEAGDLERPNQRCWMCTERRTCRRIRGQWECRACQQHPA